MNRLRTTSDGDLAKKTSGKPHDLLKNNTLRPKRDFVCKHKTG